MSSSASNVAICWFRQDLRLTDNPALYHATKEYKILPIYILDTQHAGEYMPGGASLFWLHYSLQALNKDLQESLSLYQGDPLVILQKLVKTFKVSAIFWNRCYEPWQIKRDKLIKQTLESQQLLVKSFNGTLLWEPWQVMKQDGTQYKVFSPFYYKGCQQAPSPRLPLAKPKKMQLLKDEKNSVALEKLALLPKQNWDKKMKPLWDMGEKAALKKLKNFFKSGVLHYKEARNFPAKSATSKLSPHLHFGEISPQQIYHATKELTQTKHTDHFLSELGWREFSYYLLYHFPELPQKNWQTKFDNFPWENNKKLLQRWQKGQTGFPIVDAGMRELWQTGYMHNRVRMIVGSFLVKNLLINWQSGEAWFWDCLVDADLASNSASWQWVAGSGADAAPYFRIFNPILQGEKFDPDGDYTRQFVPELAKLPNKYLFKPWEAPVDILTKAGIQLGREYPHPIVDLKASRDAALAAYQKTK